MFQKRTDDGTHLNGFAHAGTTLFQAADTTDDQFDLNTGSRGLVKSIDDAGITQRVHLCNDTSRFPHRCVVAFTVDQFDKTCAEPGRGQC